MSIVTHTICINPRKAMISEALYLYYLNALLNGNKQQCKDIIINQIDQKVSLKEIYKDLFQRSMYRIGQMWEKEKCSISSEHIATKITEGLIDLVTNNYSTENKNGKSVVVTCIDKEYHELGARMVAGFFETYGWNSIFVGANIPCNEITKLIGEKRPDVVGISSSFYININRLIKLIQSIKDEFPDQEIIIGGQALAEGRSECLSPFPNVSYISCLNTLEEYIQKYQS
jgi:MerR family transcriptional regulator, light-induced transcriptional regulator